MLSEEPNALNEEQKKQMLHNIYNNKDNNKYNNKYNKYPKGYEGIDFSFLSSDFTEVFLEWLCYKQERKECYKSERALRACYNKLVKISGGSPAMAEKIISESMANNWKGFFELDKQKNGDNKQTGAERQYQAGATAYERVVARITERQNKPPKETDGELFSD